MTKGMMPVIEMKPDKTIIDYWQTPYVRSAKQRLQQLLSQLTEAHNMHVLRKQLKMDQDPWDNYLIHDSKYFVPLLCHSKELPIEHQVLLVTFIRQSISDETISQYKLKSHTLIGELVKFASEFKEEDDEPSVLDKIKAAAEDFLLKDTAAIDDEVERVVKMFYL